MKKIAGDTLVEVMVSMSILGLVMGAAFATSRHSLQSGLQSSYRDQADSYARQQVELIKKLDVSGSLIGYQDPNFCINPNGPIKQAVSNDTHLCPLPVGSGNPTQYSVVDKYDSATKIYTVEVQWPSSNANSPNTVSLQYKPRNSFVDTPNSFNPPTSNPTTQPPAAWLNFTTDKGDNPTVQAGTNMNLVWSTMPPAGRCDGSGVGGSWNSSSKPASGTFAISPTSTSTYILTCYDLSGHSSLSKQQTITVNQRPQITMFKTTNSLPITYNTSTNIVWSSTSAVSCTGGGFNTQGAANNTSPGVSTGNLTSNTTYTLTCSGGAATTPATGSLNVTVGAPPPPPPQITAFGTWSENTIYTSKGTQRYLYWYNNSSTTRCYLSNYGNVSPNSSVYIYVYPGTYTLTCYNDVNQSTSSNFSFNYHSSSFIAYQHARFDPAWPGWTWGPVGEGSYGLPGDMSSFSVYGRAAVRDNYGHCANFTVDGWTLYGWVEDYGLVNDRFGTVDVGHDCNGL